MTTSDPKGFRFRESTRAPYETNVVLRFERDGEPSAGYSANVSMEGMFVRTDDPRAVGTLVQFEFDLEGSTIQGLGDTVWIRTRSLGADKPPGMGVQFRYVDPQSRDLIAKIVDRYLQSGRAPDDREEDSAPTESPADSPAGGLPPTAPIASEAPTVATPLPAASAPLMPPSPPAVSAEPVLPVPSDPPTAPLPSAEVLPPPLTDTASPDPLADFELSDGGSSPSPDPALDSELSARPLRDPLQGDLLRADPLEASLSPLEPAPASLDLSPPDSTSTPDSTPLPGVGSTPGMVPPAAGAAPPEKEWTPPPASKLPGGEGGLTRQIDEPAIRPLAGATASPVVSDVPPPLDLDAASEPEPASIFPEAEPLLGEPSSVEDEGPGYFEPVETEQKGPSRLLTTVFLLLLLVAAGWFLRDRVLGLLGMGGTDEMATAAPATEPPAQSSAEPTADVPQEMESVSEPAPGENASMEDLSQELPEEEFLSEFEDLDSEDLGAGDLEEEEPAQEPAPAVTRPAPERRPTPAAPAATPSAGAAPSRLTEITASSAASGTEIRIRGTGSIDAGGYTALKLSGPPRLLVRINGVTAPYDTSRLSGQEFSGVRSGLHNTAERGPEIHLVFDLTSESVRSEVVPDGGGLLIRLSP